MFYNCIVGRVERSEIRWTIEILSNTHQLNILKLNNPAPTVWKIGQIPLIGYYIYNP